ncbi:MAG: arginine--tRNA ligase, partial [Vampirovibrionales bacterium]|nr:arginine--tRNA ligase [Vampirovibrionales bacterium]
MLKAKLQQAFLDTLHTVYPQLPELGLTKSLKLNIERPKNPDFGDFAVNVSPLTKTLNQAASAPDSPKLSPPQIASQLQAPLQTALAQQGWPALVTLAGGYLNITFSTESLAKLLVAQLALPASALGNTQTLAHESILLEYVSANPTGPLHVGHGRWAALGDSIARLLRAAGAQVTTEFYINDVGVQMNHLAASLLLRCAELLDLGPFPTPPEPLPNGEKPPYPYYPGDYLIPLAQQFLDEYPTLRSQIVADYKQFQTASEQHQATPSPDLSIYKAYAYKHLLAQQKNLLDTFRVSFDVWQTEQAVRDSGQIEAVLSQLRQSGYAYEEAGALWLKSSALGDEKDRV